MTDNRPVKPAAIKPTVARPVHDRLQAEQRALMARLGRKVTISEVIERLLRYTDKARAAGIEEDQ